MRMIRLQMRYNRKLDRILFKKDLSKFIPPVCHIDDRTLLTRNGELIQIIAIEGISSKAPERKLELIRATIREAIAQYTNPHNAIWIHTVRQKKNLDETSDYPNLLSTNINRLWRDKNHWDGNFVNTLYISILHSGAQLDTKHIVGFFNSFFVKKVYDFHNKYITSAKKQLTTIIDNIITHLKDFDPQLLRIKEEDGKMISEPMGLFIRIALLKEEQFIIEEQDLSLAISNIKFDIGSEMIEIQSAGNKKFASMLGIKGYQEIHNNNLDLLLQVPAEMIITEMFYYIDKQKIRSFYMPQYRLTKIAKNTDINKIKYFDKIFIDQDKPSKFCNQQISVMCIGDTINELKLQLSRISKGLSSLGISYVQEDIAIEHSYWSQMPGNFSLCTRLYPNLLEHTAAFGALHNPPIGNKYSKWGKAVSLIRTTKGMPYFFNFFNKQNIGHTCITGHLRSGRTILTNFLLSESTKYKPKILYIKTDNSSQIFLKAIGAISCTDLEGCSPLYKTSGDTDYIKQLMTMMLFNGNIETITAEETTIINDCSLYLSKAKGLKSLSDFIKTYKFNAKDSRLKKDLEFCATNQYKKYFDIKSKKYIGDSDILEVDFSTITNQAFKAAYYTSDKKLIDGYYHNMQLNSNARSAVFYSLIRTVCSGDDTRPKIIVVDDLFEIFSAGNLTSDNLANLLEYITKHNGILIANIDISNYDKMYQPKEWRNLLTLFTTKCILASETVDQAFQEIFSLSKEEFQNYLLLSPRNRMFLLKQDDNLVSLELSLGGLSSILKILSAGESEIQTFNDLLSQPSTKDDEWLTKLYEKFNQE